MIVLTSELIEQLKTPAGGYNQATLNVLGVYWPPQAGWKRRLIGSEVSDHTWKCAVKAAAAGRVHRFRGNTRRR